MRSVIVIFALLQVGLCLDNIFSFQPGTNATDEQKAQAAAIQTSLAKFTSGDVIAKTIRYFAAENPAIRNFLVAAKNVQIPALMCVGQVLTQVRTQIQLHQITPNEIENKVLSSCAPYKAQIQPLITASHAIQEAYSGQTTGYLAQFPQAVQDVISNGSALQVLIQNDPSLLNNTAELGPKVKAFTGLIRALSDSDREAVVKELPFLAPVLLSNGSQYATYNSFLNNVDAFTSGESYDKDELLSELNSIHGYFVSVIPQAIDHFYDLIQNATIPEDIVNDNELNAFIKTATSLGQKYGGAFINSGKLAFLLASGISGVFVFTS